MPRPSARAAAAGSTSSVEDSDSRRFSSASGDFHDPRYCFQAQGWSVGQVKPVVGPEAGGLSLSRCRVARGGEEREALYFYGRGSGTLDSAWKLYLASLRDSALRRPREPVCFVRLIYDPARVDRSEALAFVREIWPCLKRESA